MDESLDFHNRALLQYEKFTVGKNNHRTADVCIKVADHYVRLNQYQGARFVASFYLLSLVSTFNHWRSNLLTYYVRRTLLDQALKIYGDREFYAPEQARAKFKKAKLLMNMGEGSAADVCFAEALALYRGLKHGDDRAIVDLDDDDFDDMITFWSR
jgi:hypothetical protein